MKARLTGGGSEAAARYPPSATTDGTGNPRKDMCTTKSIFPLAALFLLLPQSLLAQQNPAAPVKGNLPISVASGAVGSFAGAWIGATIADASVKCRVEEADCGVWEVVKGFGIGSVVGAAVGAHVGERLTGGRPSKFGNTAGAVVGLLAGIGMGVALASDDSPGVFIVSFSLTQGTLAALGGREVWINRERSER